MNHYKLLIQLGNYLYVLPAVEDTLWPNAIQPSQIAPDCVVFIINDYNNTL